MTRDGDEYFVLFFFPFLLFFFCFVVLGSTLKIWDMWTKSSYFTTVSLNFLLHQMEVIVPTLRISWNSIILTMLYWAPLPLTVIPTFLVLSLPTSLLKMTFMSLFSYCSSQMLGEKCKNKKWFFKVCQCILGKGFWSRRELEMAKEFSPRYNWSNNGYEVVQHEPYLHWRFVCNTTISHSSWIKLI